MSLLRLPLFKILPCYLGGILCAVYLPIALPNYKVLYLFFGLVTTYLLISKHQNYKSIVVLLLVFLFGITQIFWMQPTFQKYHYLYQIKPKKQELIIEITARYRKTSKDRYEAEVQSIEKKATIGKILVYSNQSFAIGETILAKAEIKKPKPSSLPGNFNYQKYLSNKHIFGQVFLTNNNSKTIAKKNTIAAKADKIRNRIIESLAQAGCNARELYVISALLLGQQQDIASDLIDDYRNAGAVHILSVSGLHIGFVVVFIGFILRPMPNTPGFREIKWLLILVALWSFALLAGLAPSVVRSATMFSLLSAGHYLRRTTNIYNTLAASAFLILIVDPYLIFDVGFQLSYAALLFIVWLQPLLQQWCKPQNQIVRYFWDILTVSFAAQLGTLPLTLYYFHQFPGLFFVTNLFIIPILSVVMTTGAIAIIPACFGAVPTWLATLLEKQVLLMNSIIQKIAQIDGALLTAIPMNMPILLSFYLSIVLIVNFANRSRGWSVLLTAILVVQISILSTLYYYTTTTELVISNTGNNTFLLKRHGTHISLRGAGHYEAIKNYAQSRFSTISEKRKLRNYETYDSHKIFIADSSAKLPCAPFDILVLSQNPKINLMRLLENCRPKIVVATTNNFPSNLVKWKGTCGIKKIPFHTISEKGPFIMKN